MGHIALTAGILGGVSSKMKCVWINLLKNINRHIRSEEIGGLGMKPMTSAELLKALHCDVGKRDKVFTPGRMWGQIKVHKPSLAYRPIVENSVKLGKRD